jgi:hypothetical protein
MKKLLYLTVALVALITSSCTEEPIKPSADNNTQTETNTKQW